MGVKLQLEPLQSMGRARLEIKILYRAPVALFVVKQSNRIMVF